MELFVVFYQLLINQSCLHISLHSEGQRLNSTPLAQVLVNILLISINLLLYLKVKARTRENFDKDAIQLIAGWRIFKEILLISAKIVNNN